jgi:hypothetical protein
MLEVWQETEAAMRPILIILFSLILVGMLTVTTIASLDRGIFSVGSELLSDRWFQATLADAYFGFITFYVWVAYKEATIIRRVIWFVLIMTLGNIAMSIYVLIQLVRMKPQDGWSGLLLRREQV